MKKIFFQASLIIALFLVTWFALSKVDWIAIFYIEQVSKTMEEKLGDLFEDFFIKSGKEIQHKEVTLPLDSILSKICVSNGIDQSQVKLHIIESDEINAFALPNKHLILYSGLISASENEAELSGVISHELAHMEMNHVMKKLIKEVGLTVLISITTGNSGSEIIKETIKLLSSSAYDRNLEKEADIKAVEYLIKSNIDPEPFANFLNKVADSESQVEKHLSWINTHPASKERAEYIIEHGSGKPKKIQPILTKETWDRLKENMKEM
ncbi:MAG: M48 family metallopeptidase [Bacteroidota bacterium]|nr:M48 family metallopeptidase [Bacteroidota bacterium]